MPLKKNARMNDVIHVLYSLFEYALKNGDECICQSL